MGVAAGRTRYLGVSNYDANQIRELMAFAKVKPVANQFEVHPHLQQDELFKACEEHGITVCGYGPLKPFTKDLAGGRAAVKIAEELGNGATAAQVMLQWATQRGFAPITTTTKAHRLPSAVAATKLELTQSHMETLNS